MAIGIALAAAIVALLVVPTRVWVVAISSTVGIAVVGAVIAVFAAVVLFIKAASGG